MTNEMELLKEQMNKEIQRLTLENMALRRIAVEAEKPGFVYPAMARKYSFMSRENLHEKFDFMC